MQAYYDYVNHMIIAYLHHPDSEPVNGSAADRINWITTNQVLSALTGSELDIVKRLYLSQEGTSVRLNVKQCALDTGASERAIWTVVRKVGREIAVKRGLV